MSETSVLLLAACMLLGAALYTSVGHAGASAYIALMAQFGVAPAVMRPTALALNIMVAGFTSFRCVNAGLFRWSTLWPFLVARGLGCGGCVHPPQLYGRIAWQRRDRQSITARFVGLRHRGDARRDPRHYVGNQVATAHDLEGTWCCIVLVIAGLKLIGVC